MLRVYADADLAGNWLKEYVEFDPTMTRSESGGAITHANYPVLWASKLKLQVALSTMEAKYRSLSIALWHVIPFM